MVNPAGGGALISDSGSEMLRGEIERGGDEGGGFEGGEGDDGGEWGSGGGLFAFLAPPLEPAVGHVSEGSRHW